MDIEIKKTADEIAKEYAQKRADIEAQQRQAEIEGIEVREIDYLLDENNSQLFILKGLLENELYFNTTMPYLNNNVFESDRNLESIYNSIIAFHNKYNKQPKYGDIQADANHLFDSVVSLQLLEEIQKLPTPSYDVGSIIYDVTRSAIFYENMRVESARYLSSDGEYSGKYKPKKLSFQEWRSICDGKILEKMQKLSEIKFEFQQGVSLMDVSSDALKKEILPKVSTGIQSLDFLLGGGYSDKTLNIVMAATGGGKTSFMINLAINAVKSGHRVLYLSLEIPELDIIQKIYARAANVHPMKLKTLDSAVLHKKKMDMFGGTGGDVVVKDYPAGTLKASSILSKLKLEAAAGFYYDMIIVDYLGLMDSDKSFSRDSMYSKLKSISEELHSLSKIAPARDREGLPIITGVQSTREGMNKDYKDEGTLDLNDISESIGIAQTADTIIGLAKISNKSYNKVKSFDLVEWIENNPSDISNEKRNFVSCRVIKNRNTGYLNSLIFEARFDIVKFVDIPHNLTNVGCSDGYQENYKIKRKNDHLKAAQIRKNLDEERFKKIQEINAEFLNEIDASRAVIKEEAYTIKDDGNVDVEGNIVVVNPIIEQMEKKKEQFEMPNIAQNEEKIEYQEDTQAIKENSEIGVKNGENPAIEKEFSENKLEPISMEDFMRKSNEEKLKSKGDMLDISKFTGSIPLNESIQSKTSSVDSVIEELFPNFKSPIFDPTNSINHYTDLFKLDKRKLPNLMSALVRVQIDAIEEIRNVYEEFPPFDCSNEEYKQWQIKMNKSFKENYGLNIENQKKFKYDYESTIERFQRAKEDLKASVEIDIENRMSDIQSTIVSFYENLEDVSKKTIEEKLDSGQNFTNYDKKIETLVRYTLSIDGNSKISGKNSANVLKYLEEEIETNDLIDETSKGKYEKIPLALGFGRYVSKDTVRECLTNHHFNSLYNISMFPILRILWLFENSPMVPTSTYYYYRDVFFVTKLKLSLEENGIEKDYPHKSEEFLKLMFEWSINGKYDDLSIRGFVRGQNCGMILNNKGSMFNIFQFILADKNKMSNLSSPISTINAISQRFKNDKQFAEKLLKFEVSDIIIEESDGFTKMKGYELFPHNLLEKAIETGKNIISSKNQPYNFLSEEYRKIQDCISFKIPKRFKNSKDEFISNKKKEIQSLMENSGKFEAFHQQFSTILETIIDIQNCSFSVEIKNDSKIEPTPIQFQQQISIESKNETPSIVDNVDFGETEETLSFVRFQVLNQNNIKTWIEKFQNKYSDKITKWANASIIAAFWNFLGYQQIGKNKFIQISSSSVYVDNPLFQKCIVNSIDEIEGETINDDIVVISELMSKLKDVEILQDFDFETNFQKKFPLLSVRLAKLKSLQSIDVDLIAENFPSNNTFNTLNGVNSNNAMTSIESLETNQNFENSINNMTFDTIKQALIETKHLFPEFHHLTDRISKGDDITIDEIHQSIKTEALSLNQIVTDDKIQQNINYWKQKGKLKGDLKYYQQILDYLENIFNNINRPTTNNMNIEINKMMFEIDFKNNIQTPNIQNFKNEVVETYQAKNGDDDLDILIKEKSKYQKGFLAYFQRQGDKAGLTNSEQALEIEKKQALIEEKHNLILQKIEDSDISEEAKLWALNRMMTMQSVGDDSDFVIPEYILNPKDDKSIRRKHQSFLDVPIECEIMLGDIKREHIEVFLQSRFVSYDINASDSELEMLAINEWLKIPSKNSQYILSLNENKRKIALHNVLFSISSDESIDKMKNELDEINSLKNPVSSNIFKRQLLDVYEKHFQDNGICLDLAETFLSENNLPSKYEYYTLNSYWELKTTMFREFLTEMKIICNPEFYKEFNTYKQFRNFKLNMVDMEIKRNYLDDISIKKANIIKGYYALENLERLWMFDNEIAFCKNKWLLPALYRDIETTSGYDAQGNVLTRQNKLLKDLTPEEMVEYDREVFDELQRISKYSKEAHMIINKTRAEIEESKLEQSQF